MIKYLLRGVRLYAGDAARYQDQGKKYGQKNEPCRNRARNQN